MAETQFSPGVISIENDQPIIDTQPINLEILSLVEVNNFPTLHQYQHMIISKMEV